MFGSSVDIQLQALNPDLLPCFSAFYVNAWCLHWTIQTGRSQVRQVSAGTLHEADTILGGDTCTTRTPRAPVGLISRDPIPSSLSMNRAAPAEAETSTTQSHKKGMHD